MKTLLRLATHPGTGSSLVRAVSADDSAGPVPVGERWIGLAVVAFLLLVMFA